MINKEKLKTENIINELKLKICMLDLMKTLLTRKKLLL